MAYHNEKKKSLNTNTRTQDSCIKGLEPYTCFDTLTGEVLSPSTYEPEIISLIRYVKEKTEEIVSTREKELISMLDDLACPHQAVGAMQRYGINANTNDLGKNILQKYRINRLIMHKTFTEYKAYHNNEDPKKQPPSFDYKINLGAVDQQMVQLSVDVDHQVLALRWKCWTRDITLLFSIPEYVFEYDINKFCLPTIQYSEDTGKILYYFTVRENLSYRLDNKSCHRKTIVGGYDLGRVEPFVLTVMTDTGKIIAARHASARLKQLNDKREGLLKEKKILKGKLKTYDKLGCRPVKYDVYEQQVRELSAKASVLGKEIARLTGSEIAGLCEHHGVDIVAGETLNWVNDRHGSSRWVHGEAQESVAHSVRRSHVKHFTVSAAHSSCSCSRCGSRDVSVDSSASRVVSCKSCGHSGDRDVVASENIASRRARSELRSRFRELLRERSSSCGDGLSCASSCFCWCPDGLAGRWGLAVGGWCSHPVGQAFLPLGNTVLFWNSHSMFDRIKHLIYQTSKL